MAAGMAGCNASVAKALGSALHRRLCARSSATSSSQRLSSQPPRRWLAVPAAKTMPNAAERQQQQVFDRGAKANQRSRAARADNSRAYDYLRVEAADRLVDRLRVRTNRPPSPPALPPLWLAAPAVVPPRPAPLTRV